MTTANVIVKKLQRDEANRGWIFYDGDCALCTATASRFSPLLNRHHFNLAPLQSPWAMERIGAKPEEPLPEMKLLAADGNIFGGADALLQIAKQIWWAWPLFALAQIPGVKIFRRAAYRRVAANRLYLSGLCGFHPKASHHRTIVFFEMP
jgi:predicted DCC family thiol-disulfide oxidoreductase YuxK